VARWLAMMTGLGVDCGGAVHTNCGCIHSVAESVMVPVMVPVSLTDDPYLPPWQWTRVIPTLVGGPADGQTEPGVRRCDLPDTIIAEEELYRIGIYRDAHTVEYVPA